MDFCVLSKLVFQTLRIKLLLFNLLDMSNGFRSGSIAICQAILRSVLPIVISQQYVGTATKQNIAKKGKLLVEIQVNLFPEVK